MFHGKIQSQPLFLFVLSSKISEQKAVQPFVIGG